MATKVKPSRLNVSGTPQVGQVPVYVDEDTFSWGAGGGGGSGDVSGPASSTDGDVVLFDGVTGKLIKDSGVGLSSKLDTTALSDTAYGSGWDGDTTHVPTKNAVYDEINSIEVLIPSAATSSNQLADKDYVNDGINSVTAYYITKNAQGDQWATRAELFAATTFYSGGVVRVPTKNDYTIVLADENHDNATTRYIYNSGWEYQYTVNETAMSQAQLDALNSGITSGKVSTYDGYATTISGKQDALTLPATPTQGNLVVRGANNKTIADGGAIPTGVPSGGNNGDVLTNVSGTPTWAAPSGGITKVFTLASTSDLTTAQAAYDRYASGGNPIIKGFNAFLLVLEKVSASEMIFSRIELFGAVNTGTMRYGYSYVFTLSSGSVTAITAKVNMINLSSSAPTSGNNSTITLVI